MSACINSLQPFVASHRETKKEVTFQKKLLISRYVVVEDIKMTPYSVQMLDVTIGVYLKNLNECESYFIIKLGLCRQRLCNQKSE